ncbi:MAG: NAD(P)H-dependent oxidoreductase [Gammaproteobacteria bacterium]|nr:NAD(P)H-dependent oxidoreductase [Gammaproteobacteria bacterium]
MIRLVGFAGSLRRGSYNRMLLEAAARAVPSGAALEIFPIDDIPLYNADIENSSGVPHAVATLKDGIRAADGLVIATPEYNNSIPGVAKNVIDWLSRPPSDVPHVLRGKLVALIGATPGGGGTMLAQAAWLPVLRTLRMRLWTGGGPFYVSQAAKSFDDTTLTDPDVEKRLQDYLAAFVDELRRASSASHSDP